MSWGMGGCIVLWLLPCLVTETPLHPPHMDMALPAQGNSCLCIQICTQEAAVTLFAIPDLNNPFDQKWVIAVTALAFCAQHCASVTVAHI